MAIYEGKGLSPATANQVAVELTEHDVLAAHLDAELNLDPNDLADPVHAATASALAFVVGALLPLLAILLPPHYWRVPVTFVAVLIALAASRRPRARRSANRAAAEPSPGSWWVVRSGSPSPMASGIWSAPSSPSSAID